MSDLREKISEICIGGMVGKRAYIHGGGFYVCHPVGMKRQPYIYPEEDEAYLALSRLRADAILDLVTPDIKAEAQ